MNLSRAMIAIAICVKATRKDVAATILELTGTSDEEVDVIEALSVPHARQGRCGNAA